MIMNQMLKLAISVMLLMVCISLSSAQSIEIKAENGTALPDSIPVNETFTVLITENGNPVGENTSMIFTLPAGGDVPIYSLTDESGKARYLPLITGTLSIRVLDGDLVTVANATVNVIVPPDTTPPTITITSPTDGQTFTTATITVSGSASDTVGLIKVEVKVGSGDWQIASGTTSWTESVTLASGSNTIYARATDTSGNTKETSVTVTYDPPDTTDPTITITSPTSGQTFTTATLTVSGSASDNVGLSKVEVKVGSGSWQIASGTTSWSKSVTLASGSNTIHARATDTSGNTKETSVTVTYDPPTDTAIISIADATASPSDTTTTPITINDMTNFGTATVTLSYDPTVVQIGSVTAGDVGTPTANIDNTAGTATITAYVSTVTGPDSPITFANLELLAVGSNGDTSPLTLVITTLSDADGNSVDVTPMSGVFVVGTIKGDLNGDGYITAADAAIALRIAVSGEYVPEADIDGNGCVTSLDALMIMQAAAGRIEL
jgi:hypothetical protein